MGMACMCTQCARLSLFSIWVSAAGAQIPCAMRWLIPAAPWFHACVHECSGAANGRHTAWAAHGSLPAQAAAPAQHPSGATSVIMSMRYVMLGQCSDAATLTHWRCT